MNVISDAMYALLSQEEMSSFYFYFDVNKNLLDCGLKYQYYWSAGLKKFKQKKWVYEIVDQKKFYWNCIKLGVSPRVVETFCEDDLVIQGI